MDKDEIRRCIEHDTHKFFKIHHHEDVEYLYNGEKKIFKFYEVKPGDGNAASLSRPKKVISEEKKILKKQDMYNNNVLHESLVFNKNNTEEKRVNAIYNYIKEYIESPETTEVLYEKLLSDKNIFSILNESSFMPASSLKYHILLVSALQYNFYLNRNELYLNYTEKPPELFTTIFKYNNHHLVINIDKNGGSIGEKMSPHFGDTIGRLQPLPFPDFIIENLRRIRSWSVGLQYLEDVLQYLENNYENNRNDLKLL